MNEELGDETMEPIYRDKLVKEAVERIRKLDEKGKVQFITLYGSLVESREGKLSDIDIAIYYDADARERFSFRVRAQGRLGDKFDIQIFQDLPTYVKKEVVSGGKVLFYKDYDFLFNVYLGTLREYADFEKYLNTYYSYLEGVEIEEAR